MLFSRWSERLEKWVRAHAHTRRAQWVLATVSFAESSFFPIPPDVLLVGIQMMGVRRWWRTALITTAASVLGGAFGYLIGLFFFDSVGAWIISTYSLEDEMNRVGGLYASNAFLAVFTAGFTPIPYKIFTIAAGFFHIDFLVFILASVLSRGMRFFLVSYLAHRYGERIARLIFRYMDVALIILVLVFLAVYGLSKISDTTIPHFPL